MTTDKVSSTCPALATEICIQKTISLLAKESGFESITSSALEAFSSVIDHFFENILLNMHAYAELGNRVRPNYHDILRSLQDYSGLDLDHLKEYVTRTAPRERIPELETPKEAVDTTKETTSAQFLPSEDEAEEEHDEATKKQKTLPPYVPSHLPPFPSRHSFRQTPVYIKRPDDPQKVRELNSQQSRIVEENLKRLMSTENQLARGRDDKQLAEAAATGVIPIVNYENSVYRRRWAKRSASSSSGYRNTNSSSSIGKTVNQQ